MFIALIFMRILFAACMVFIIGYIFGPFAKRPALARIARVASILAVVLFISTNILLFRIGHWRGYYGNGPACYGWQQQHQQAPANTKPAP